MPKNRGACRRWENASERWYLGKESWETQETVESRQDWTKNEKLNIVSFIAAPSIMSQSAEVNEKNLHVFTDIQRARSQLYWILRAENEQLISWDSQELAGSAGINTARLSFYENVLKTHQSAVESVLSVCMRKIWKFMRWKEAEESAKSQETVKVHSTA